MNTLLSFASYEFKRFSAYRADFWMNYITQNVVVVLIAWSVWSFIYAQEGVSSIAGMDMTELVVYYLISPIMLRVMIGPNIGNISRDIYEGGLNRYLVFPVDFLKIKLTTHAVHSILFAAQIVPVMLMTDWLAGGVNLHWERLLYLLPVTAVSVYVFFHVVIMIEGLSFWVEHTWSLGVMLRHVLGLCGGVIVPLRFFPDIVSHILELLPFYAMIGFPADFLLGKSDMTAYLQALLTLGFWAIVCRWIALRIWNHGLYTYSGVGA